MGIISKNALSWLPTIQTELMLSGNPLPPELILSVLDTESRGKPGLVNPKSGASGLMQVMPVVVNDYNKSHKQKISIEQMRSPNHGLLQIRVGIWILGQFWRGADRYLSKRLNPVPVDILSEIADLFYVAGPGATRKRLDKVNPPTYDSVRATFPEWNALPHVENVMSRFNSMGGQFNTKLISEWLASNVDSENFTSGQGAVLGLMAIALAYWYIQRGKK